MKVSIKSDYALRAVLELALNYKQRTLGAAEIARKQVIPKRYLEQILLSLKKTGIVNSFRGKDGGYSLKSSPKEITVANVINAIEGEFSLIPKRKRKKTKDVILDVWTKAQNSVLEVLNSVTIEDLVKKRKQSEKVLTYII